MRGAALAAAALALSGCGNNVSPAASPTVGTLTVTSPDLAGGTFAARLTCDGADRPPDVRWSAGPPATRSYAVELTDPDAPGGSFTHWVLYHVPQDVMDTVAALARASPQGTNSFGKVGYGGPCPPRGNVHHYHFTVLALDTGAAQAPGLTREQLDTQLADHVLARGELVATYRRP